MRPDPAPELAVSQWFNTNGPVSLVQLSGSVVVIEAFQMLCPGCVSHGLPLAKAVHEHFSQEQVAVIGLHSVFEHHDAMTPVSLQAFLHEYRIPFPVGVDKPGRGAMPETMAAYGMRGTPTLVLIDRQGRRRAQYFGHVPDMRIGADIATLLAEPRHSPIDAPRERCDESRCEVDVES
ncbi:MAG: redoxin domain-containing protein [Bauldia sp.]|uniref:redoxin domain-containing protein n=1 Tax=Bauldia sp. TaxID=2575872 RepID=UPI001DBA2C7B|nr:redoxin domain-containing protein [Bauldia sp.]MCB1494528.1 redoxin domain-containing protein [Bauldia sp.]